MIKYKDTAEDWLARIEAGLEYRRLYGREDWWARLESMYANLENSGADVGPNLIQEMADTLSSNLNISRPEFSVRPSMLDPQSITTYPIVNAVDNWLMSELEIPETISETLLFAFLWGRGIVKFGYDSEWGFDESFDLGEVHDPIGITLTQFNKKGQRLEYAHGKSGMPWMMPVLPHDIVVPWGVKSLKRTPWVAHRIVRHIDLLKADVKYEKVRDLQPNMAMEDFVDSYKHVQLRYRAGVKTLGGNKWNPNGLSRHSEYVELWEVHNYMTGEIITLSYQAIHRKGEDLLQVDGLPFDSLTYVPHPRTFWTTPQAQYLDFHQLEQNDIAKQASNQRRINSLKFLIKAGAMEPSELEKALSPNVGITAEVNAGFDLKDVMTPVPQTTNFPLYQDAEQVRRNA